MNMERPSDWVWLSWLRYVQSQCGRYVLHPAALRPYRRWETLPLAWREALIEMERPVFRATVAYVPLTVRRAWWKRVLLTRELREGVKR